MNQIALKETPGTPPADNTRDDRQHLTFMLGKETFAIGILAIKEIIEYGQLTTVPMMPVFIRGVINLRGSVVPVVDLAVRFGGTPAEVTRRTCIIIIEFAAEDETQVAGVVVDAVNEVLEIPAADILPPPAFGASIRADFIKGMGKVQDKFVIILDVDKVLSVDDLALLEQAAHAKAESGVQAECH